MTTENDDHRTVSRHPVDMSPAAIRARLRKVDELRRLAKYLSGFKPVRSETSVETDADPTQQ